jgi:hypothetical protein
MHLRRWGIFSMRNDRRILETFLATHKEQKRHFMEYAPHIKMEIH